MSGWFAMKRGITSHHLFKGKPERLAIWAWLLDNAAWKDTVQDVNGKTVQVPRGSVCASERRIAEEVGVGYQVVRTFLSRLESEHMINAAVVQGRSMITLCNWDKYQVSETRANAEPNAAPTQDQRSVNAQKEQGNKDTSIETAKAVSPRKSRIAENATISAAQMAAGKKRGHDEREVLAQFEKFKNDALAKGKTFASWDRAFVTWLDSEYFKPVFQTKANVVDFGAFGYGTVDR